MGAKNVVQKNSGLYFSIFTGQCTEISTTKRELKINRTAKNRKRGKVQYFTSGLNFERKTKEKKIASLK